MEPEEPKIDWFIFTTTGIVIAVVTLLLLLAPQASQEAITTTFSFITGKTGLLYIWFGIGVMFFLLLVALGTFGSITLGPSNERPEHSTLSWIAMLFSTGIGTAILYWGTIEWVNLFVVIVVCCRCCCLLVSSSSLLVIYRTRSRLCSRH